MVRQFLFWAVFTLTACDNHPGNSTQGNLADSSSTITPSITAPIKETIDTTITININKDGKLSWATTNEEENTNFEIEEYRWNKWLLIGQLRGKGTGNHSYTFLADTSCGLYQIRIVVKGISTHHSKTIDFPNPKDVRTKGCGGQFFNFNTKTKYEVYDPSGNKLLLGCDNKVDLSSLQKGVFFMNYGNKIAEFVHN